MGGEKLPLVEALGVDVEDHDEELVEERVVLPDAVELALLPGLKEDDDDVDGEAVLLQLWSGRVKRRIASFQG